MGMKKIMIHLGACLLVLLIGVTAAELYKLKLPGENMQQEYTKLTFWTVGDRYADYMLSCAQEYNRQTDGEKIDLDVQVYSRGFIVDQINKSLLNDEQVPDLADIRFTDMHQFVNSAEHSMFLYPLGSLLPGKEKPREAALDAFSFNNILLALPYGRGEMVLFINEDLLNKQKIDPEAICSWEDFLNLGENLQRQGIRLLAMDVNNWDLLLAMMLQRDAEIANAADSARIAASREFSQLVSQLKDAVEHGWVEAPEELDIYNQRFYKSFGEGEYLCVAAPMEYSCELIDNVPELSGKVAIRPLPDAEEDGSTPLVAQYGTAILARSKNIRLAKRFLEFAKLGEARYREMADKLYVRSVSSQDDRRVPDALEFQAYFGEDAFRAFNAGTECGYSAESGLPEALAPLAAEFLSVYDN